MKEKSPSPVVNESGLLLCGQSCYYLSQIKKELYGKEKVFCRKV